MNIYANMFFLQSTKTSWTAYDIWSTDSECVEDIILEELDFAAELGIEVFYIDAAWWAGSSIKGQGAWGWDLEITRKIPRKFPNGLKYISDRVHKKGQKFGLWVDPMIIDEQWLTSRKIPDRWLVKQDGIISSLDLKTERLAKGNTDLHRLP